MKLKFAVIMTGISALLPLSDAIALSLNQRDATSHSLTLYQQNNALVQSHFETAEPLDTLSIDGLPPGLNPASVLLNGVNASSQRWSAGKDAFQTALKAAIDTEIELINTETSEKLSVRLLALTPPYFQVLRDGKILRIPIDGAWQPSLPYQPIQDLGELSFTHVKSSSQTSGFDLTYLSSGLGWTPEYTIELISDQALEISARAALRNDTQADFTAASVDLLAGQPDMPVQAAPRMLEMAAMAADAAPAPAAESVQGYYLFRLPKAIDLPAGSQQRVPLIATRQLDAQLSYRYEQWAYAGYRAEPEKEHARQWLKFELPESISESPLPQGQAQLFRRDDSGKVRFIGSQTLRNTSPGQAVEFAYGDAFDLKVQRRQLDYQRNGRVYRQGYEVRFENGSNSARTLEYKVNFRQPWTMIESSALATSDGMEARWTVEIPARSDLVLTYTVDLNQI